MVDRQVGFFGTFCGGTTYVAMRLRSSGLRVGHEEPHANGLVCGRWAFPPGVCERRGVERLKPTSRDWDVLGVVVRHPLLCSETLPRYLRKCHLPQLEVELEDRLRAMRMWVLAHEFAREHIDSHSYPTSVLRIGRRDIFERDYSDLCSMLKIQTGSYTDADPRASHKATRWPRLTWGEWDAADAEYADRARSLLEIYSVPEDPEWRKQGKS